MPAQRSAALTPGVTPPQRIELGDLLIRRWRPADATARREAIRASFDHLRPWWDDSLIELIIPDSPADRERSMCWPSDRGSFRYGIFDLDNTVLGGIDLHDRIGGRAIELGYWSHAAHTGKGVITRATTALTETAFALPRIERLEIHCDAANSRSAAVARRAGFRLDRIEQRDKTAPADTGRTMIWISHAPTTASYLSGNA